MENKFRWKEFSDKYGIHNPLEFANDMARLRASVTTNVNTESIMLTEKVAIDITSEIIMITGAAYAKDAIYNCIHGKIKGEKLYEFAPEVFNALKNLVDELEEKGDDIVTDAENHEQNSYSLAIRAINKVIPPRPSKRTIKDGFGGVWPIRCERCKDDTMFVNRPGDARCKNCD